MSYTLGEKDKVSQEFIENYHLKEYDEIIKRKKLIQDILEYFYQIDNTRLFIYKLFGDSVKIIKNIHNALGDNLLESEEIYILNKYHSLNDCLKCLYRKVNQMIYQEFRINFILI